MAKIVIADEDKIGKEEILIGNKTVECIDCSGTKFEKTGLTADDLPIKNGNIFESLKVYIDRVAGGANIDVSSGVVTLRDGTINTIEQIVDGLEDVKFEITDLQAKYNTLKG